MRLSVRTKLIAIVGVAAWAFIVLIVASSFSATRADRQLVAIREHYLPKIEFGPQLESQFDHLRRGIQEAVAARDLEALAGTQSLLDQFRQKLASAGNAVEPSDAAALRSAVEDYYEAAIPVSRRLIGGEPGEELLDAMTGMQNKQARAIQSLEKAVSFNRGELTTAFATATQAQVTAGRVRLAISIGCLGAVVLLTFFLGRGIVLSLGELSIGLKRFGGGDFTHPIKVLSKDEIGNVAAQANQMAASLRTLSEQRDHDDWLKGILVGLGQELRGELDLEEVANRATTFLAEYLKVQAAALYYTDAEQTTTGRSLKLIGTHTVSVGEGVGELPSSFRFGEGLVGQAALREEITVVTNLPPGYLRIRSGLGAGSPEVVALVPLVHLGKVTGVLELGTFNSAWPERATEALLLVRENLVIAIEVARARAAMAALLAETQRQTLRLTEQEEELRATNEELQVRQSELQQTNRELVTQKAELEAQGRRLKENNIALDDARQTLEQKAAQLETVSAYKSQFLANMSHELRTPLNSMLLLSSLLAENEGRNLTPKQIEFAKTIHVAGKDLLSLINQVLDLAKIEAGKYQIHVGRVSLKEVLANLRMIFDPLARQKGLNFSIEPANEMPDSIHTDSQRLEQILKNLLANAIKFTEEGGVSMRVGRPPPEVRLKREDLRADQSVTFTVTDTGLGIAAEDQDRIFAPFEQVDGAADRRHGGTGLGLSIARELTTLLGGELHLQSTLGKGSTFTCVMPIASPIGGEDEQGSATSRRVLGSVDSTRGETTPTNAATMATPPEVATAGAAGRAGHLAPPELNDSCLLVVEDDPVAAEVLADVIRGQGLECLVAKDGQSALRLARERHPAGIVLDVRLPDIDGWQVMERLRGDSSTSEIPVHFVSALSAFERGMAMGAVGYLTKPASRADILRIIESLTTKAQERPARVLVVEDDMLTGDSLVRLLSGENLEIRHVTNGRDALTRLELERYGCIILDLSLPDMDGLDLLQKVRARYGATMPGVVVYTARGLSTKETQALQAYTSAVVLKEGESGARVAEEVRLFVRQLKSRHAGVAPHAKAVSRSASRLEGHKVLLVDDDMRTIYALSALLRGKGADVAVADSGQSALDVLDERTDIEAVLMDIMMPEMDGYEAMRRIRKDVRFRRLPIIALTAKAMKEDAQKCIDAGASHYLPKPVDPERLLRLLDACLAPVVVDAT